MYIYIFTYIYISVKKSINLSCISFIYDILRNIPVIYFFQIFSYCDISDDIILDQYLSYWKRTMQCDIEIIDIKLMILKEIEDLSETKLDSKEEYNKISSFKHLYISTTSMLSNPFSLLFIPLLLYLFAKSVAL